MRERGGSSLADEQRRLEEEEEEEAADLSDKEKQAMTDEERSEDEDEEEPLPQQQQHHRHRQQPRRNLYTASPPPPPPVVTGVLPEGQERPWSRPPQPLLWEEEKWRSEALLMTLLVCLGGGVVWLQRRMRGTRDPKMKSIAAALRPGVVRQMRSRGDRPPLQSALEEATEFLARELGARLAHNPDLVRQKAGDEGATIPSRRLVQEVEFYSEFVVGAQPPPTTPDLRQRMNARGFELLFHSTAAHTPPHFLAFNPDRKLAVLSILNSADLPSVIDSLDATPVPFLLNELRAAAHRDIATAAQALVSDLRTTVLDLLVPQGYHVAVVGHGMAGGVAAVVALLLREECGVRQVRACCLGPPPCMDRTSAVGCRQYVTTVVHNSDAVPRATLGSVKILSGLLGGVAASLRQGGAGKTRSHLLSILRDAQALLHSDEASLYLPGSVAYAYVNSTGAYSGALLDGTLSVLRNIEVTETMITDHSQASYEGALRHLLARLPPDDPTWHWCGTSPPTRTTSCSPHHEGAAD